MFIQELNPSLAAAISAELTQDYPHQVLDPHNGVNGMGVISKHPLRKTGQQLPLNWVGIPQILSLDWQGDEVTLVNFHMLPLRPAKPDTISHIYRSREAQALVLADFSLGASAQTPLIVAGDVNATHLSDAYRTLTRVLIDSWQEAGFGFGHTFPGSDIPFSSRPRILGWPVPQWLVRIDYVFHSHHWVSIQARTAEFDGVSDHRGVVAELVMKR